MIAAIVVLAGLPFSGYAQNRPAAQLENFERTFQQGDPSFAGLDVPLQSPNLFQVMRRSGIDVDQMLATAGYNVDWLLDQLGWRLDEAELTFALHLQLQVVTSRGIEVSYDGASQLQYVPGTPTTPMYDRRVVILGGNFKVAEGLGATNLGVTVTYRDPSGITATASGDIGVLNQDLAITIDSGRRLNRRNRHSDGWLMTFCVPLKVIIAALLVEVPPASAAALALVPDVMMQAIGDVGYRFSNEWVNPEMGRVVRSNSTSNIVLLI